MKLSLLNSRQTCKVRQSTAQTFPTLYTDINRQVKGEKYLSQDTTYDIWQNFILGMADAFLLFSVYEWQSLSVWWAWAVIKTVDCSQAS